MQVSRKSRFQAYLLHPRKGLNRFLLECDMRSARGIPWSLPMRLEIVITARCNLRCEMCFDYRKSSEDMPTGLYREVAKELFSKASIVSLIGGEPMLHPEFNDIVETASDYGCNLQMTTNGTLLNSMQVPLILRNFERITISFDGGDKETFERIRKGARFQSVLENVERLIRGRDEEGSRLIVELAFCASKDNIRQLPLVLDLSGAIGADVLTVTMLKVHKGVPVKRSLFFHQKEANQYFQIAREMADGMKVHLNLPGLFNEEPDENAVCKGWSGCTYPWDRVRIKVNGDVVACCNLMDHPMGNIKKKSFRAIWLNEHYQRFRASLRGNQPLYSQCLHCRLLSPDINDPYLHIDQDQDLKEELFRLAQE